LAEVSAGGGTIARLDTVGVLRVGPLSAGADPGPACYGKGTQPTVTDANVVLGRLNRSRSSAYVPIDASRSRAAVATVAAPLGGDVERTAAESSRWLMPKWRKSYASCRRARTRSARLRADGVWRRRTDARLRAGR